MWALWESRTSWSRVLTTWYQKLACFLHIFVHLQHFFSFVFSGRSPTWTCHVCLFFLIYLRFIYNLPSFYWIFRNSKGPIQLIFHSHLTLNTLLKCCKSTNTWKLQIYDGLPFGLRCSWNTWFSVFVRQFCLRFLWDLNNSLR